MITLLGIVFLVVGFPPHHSVNLIWESLCFLTLNVYILPLVRDAFSYFFLQISSLPLSLSLLILGPCNVNVNVLDVVPEVS